MPGQEPFSDNVVHLAEAARHLELELHKERVEIKRKLIIERSKLQEKTDELARLENALLTLRTRLEEDEAHPKNVDVGGVIKMTTHPTADPWFVSLAERRKELLEAEALAKKDRREIQELDSSIQALSERLTEIEKKLHHYNEVIAKSMRSMRGAATEEH